MHDPDVEVADGELAQVDATREGAFGHAAAAGGKQYRVLGRWKAGFVFIHTEVGIGILSLPSVLKTLGLIPGLIAILGIGILATYTAYLYLLFWRRYRHIDNLPDAMYVLGGKPLAIVGAVGLIINLSFACASSVLTMSIALNTLSGHSMCTVAFVGFAALVCYVLCMPRTMNFVSYFSGMSLLSRIHRPKWSMAYTLHCPQHLRLWVSSFQSSLSLDPWCTASHNRRLTSGRRTCTWWETRLSATPSARF